MFFKGDVNHFRTVVLRALKQIVMIAKSSWQQDKQKPEALVA